MKIAIIGAGNVGSTLAYTLAVQGVASDVSLIDLNQDKAYGEILDIAHGGAVSENVALKAEGYEGLADADIIVHAAGRGRKPGETRLDLAKGNVMITESIISEIKKHYNGKSIILVVTNPMDVLTYVMYKQMGVDSNKIIGSGTVLDSSRFKFLLSRRFKIDARNIHAMFIGEHGDSGVPLWSAAAIGPSFVLEYPSKDNPALNASEIEVINKEIIQAGQEVIKRKGATYYAVSMSVSRIIKAIADNENRVLCVSSYIDNKYGIDDVCLSLPAVVGRDGIRELLPLNLTADENAALCNSASVLKGMLKELNYQ